MYLHASSRIWAKFCHFARYCSLIPHEWSLIKENLRTVIIRNFWLKLQNLFLCLLCYAIIMHAGLVHSVCPSSLRWTRVSIYVPGQTTPEVFQNPQSLETLCVNRLSPNQKISQQCI